MSRRPWFSSREMESRSAPVSKEVKRPESSKTVTGPVSRILTENSVLVTDCALYAEKEFYLRAAKRAQIFRGGNDACGKRRVLAGRWSGLHCYSRIGYARAFGLVLADEFQR